MKHMYRRFGFLVCLLLVGMLFSTAVAHAAPYGFPDPLNNADVPTLVNRIVSSVLGIVGALFFVMFLWGGFRYMTAGGEAKSVMSARRILVNAVIGITIVAASYAITSSLLGWVAGTGSTQSSQPESAAPAGGSGGSQDLFSEPGFYDPDAFSTPQ